MQKILALTVAALTVLTIGIDRAAAQYPNVSSDIKSRSEAKKAAADKRSDEIFAKVLPQIKKDAEAGKPYLPGAAKPEDLPQADIPAFPGAWGGGMHSFGGPGGPVIVVTSPPHDRPRLRLLGTRREHVDVPPHVLPARRRQRSQAPDRQHHHPELDLLRRPQHLSSRLRLDHRRVEQHLPSQPLGLQHRPQSQCRH